MILPLKEEEWENTALILSQVKLFSGISNNKDALYAIAQTTGFKSYEEGQCILEEGQKGETLFILIEGQVSIYKKTLDGDNYKVAILSSKNYPVFGETALFERETRSASVCCDTKAQCLTLSKRNFHAFAQENPQWALPIYENICKDLIHRVRGLNHDLSLLHRALAREIKGQ
ncbi:MAG: cyclic nucleotide-binding domain-containing protein [Bdellovibrio sp.]|nr:MAG: cyclic nucleotide-binding domain-containing protein [Bdellovibrio sp.]